MLQRHDRLLDLFPFGAEFRQHFVDVHRGYDRTVLEAATFASAGDGIGQYVQRWKWWVPGVGDGGSFEWPNGPSALTHSAQSQTNEHQ